MVRMRKTMKLKDAIIGFKAETRFFFYNNYRKWISHQKKLTSLDQKNKNSLNNKKFKGSRYCPEQSAWLPLKKVKTTWRTQKYWKRSPRERDRSVRSMMKNWIWIRTFSLISQTALTKKWKLLLLRRKRSNSSQVRRSSHQADKITNRSTNKKSTPMSWVSNSMCLKSWGK